MKFFAQLLLTLTSIISLAIAGLSKEELVQLQKIQGNKVIELNDDNFAPILNGQRDYHLFLLLTSDSPLINCALCKEFKPEYDLVGNSWIKDHPNGLSEKELHLESDIPVKDVFFVSADFMDCKKLFQALQLNNIPKVYYFPPSTHPGPNNYLSEFEDYQFYQGVHSQLLIGWMKGITGHQFNIYVPLDYANIAKNAFMTFVAFFVVFRFSSQIGQFFFSKLLWSSLSIIFVLLLTTGYMFNQIRSVPYVREYGDGNTEYIFQGSLQNQLGVETQIMSFIYGFLSLLVVLLVKKVPEIKSGSVQLLSVCIISILIFVFYSILISIFGLKGSGYPYKLINFY